MRTPPDDTTEGLRGRYLTIARDAGLAYDRSAKAFDWDGYNEALVDAFLAEVSPELERLRAELARRDAAVERLSYEGTEARINRREAEAERDRLRGFFDAMTDQRDALKAAVERVRADCGAVVADGFIADDNPVIWVDGARSYARRVLALLDAEAAGSESGPAAKAFMAWIEEVGYRPTDAAVAAPESSEAQNARNAGESPSGDLPRSLPPATADDSTESTSGAPSETTPDAPTEETDG